MPTERVDAYPAFCFLVLINGISDDGTAVRGSFSEASGLEVEIPPIEYRNGSEDIRVRMLPGLKKYPKVILKRGITGHADFWNWIVEGMNGLTRRTSVTIALLDENRREVMRWNLERAWISKWTGPGLNAKNNEVALETLEICHEGLSLDGQVG